MFNPKKHHRRSIRLPGYDYAQTGLYFVTICTKNRECLFGEIVGGSMRLNEYGQIVAQCWQWLSHRYPYVGLDEWVVMPNHLHGIVVIDTHDGGGSRTAPTGTTIPMGITPTNGIKRKSLGCLIGAFKTVSTKHINVIRNTPGAPVWQRNYYERIVRNEKALINIRRYIAENPLRWAFDAENLDVVDRN